MTAAEVKALFRAFLREGRKFPNYNIREYIKRRSKEEFHANADLCDPAVLVTLWQGAKQQLEVVRKQSLVYNLYGRKVKNILELDVARKGTFS